MASRHLQWLENDLSVQLMRRSTRHIDLTDAGRAFLERARLLLADLEDAREVVRPGHGVAGRLVLSVPACLGIGKIVPLLPKFLEQHPRLRLDLRFEDRVTDLLADGVDVAIRADVRLPDSTFIVARKIVMYERILCGSPAFLRRHGRVSSVADLAQLPCIVHGTPPETAWTFATPSGPQSVVVDERVRTDNILSTRALAVAGVGIGWLPKWLAFEEFRERRLKQVLPDTAVLSPMIIYGLTHKQMRGGAAIRAVLDFLAQKLPGRLSSPAA
jgi:DNA-binding transcriptional LysR family regulator